MTKDNSVNALGIYSVSAKSSPISSFPENVQSTYYLKTLCVCPCPAVPARLWSQWFLRPAFPLLTLQPLSHQGHPKILQWRFSSLLWFRILIICNVPDILDEKETRRRSWPIHCRYQLEINWDDLSRIVPIIWSRAKLSRVKELDLKEYTWLRNVTLALASVLPLSSSLLHASCTFAKHLLKDLKESHIFAQMPEALLLPLDWKSPQRVRPQASSGQVGEGLICLS